MFTAQKPDSRSKLLIIIGLLLLTTSCTVVGDRVDHAAGGPNVPADTVIIMSKAPSEPPAEKEPQPQPSGPLRITVVEAILLTLENNRALLVERLNPSIRQTFEDEERAVFDPQTGAEISAGRVEGQRLARSGSATEAFTTDTYEAGIDLTQVFPTGTTVSVEGNTLVTDSSLYEERFYTTRLGIGFTQALLRGFGSAVNLANLSQARLDTRLSEYELRGFTQSLVAEVEQTYWDYALARREIEIFEESLKIARRQLSETLELIEVGRLAETEKAAVQAEVAAQEVAAVSPLVEVEVIPLRAGPDNLPKILAGAQVAVDCLDNLPSRYALEAAAREMNIPYVHGAVAGLEGFVMTVLPGEPGLAGLHGPAPAAKQDSAEVVTGIPALTPAATANLQVNEVVKLILGRRGLGPGTLLHLDLSVPSLELLHLG